MNFDLQHASRFAVLYQSPNGDGWRKHRPGELRRPVDAGSGPAAPVSSSAFLPAPAPASPDHEAIIMLSTFVILSAAKDRLE
jgi:hypothetical protein